MMIVAMLALVVVVGVAPALADSNDFFDRFGDNDNPNEFFGRFDDNDNHNDFFDHFFANDDFLDNFFNGNAGIEQSVEQESHSGDYASQCTPAIQFGNTGNFQNGSSFVQVGSESGDFEPGGIEVTFEPQQGVQCSNTIQQSSAASS